MRLLQVGLFPYKSKRYEQRELPESRYYSMAQLEHEHLIGFNLRRNRSRVRVACSEKS